MKNNKWFVITGGPCSGKTTTIELIKKLGHKTTHETARNYISSQIEKGLSAREIFSAPQKLQDEIARLQIVLESSLLPEEITFMDRAFPDVIGYYNHHQIKIPYFSNEKYKKSTYNKIFFLERMPTEKDEIRQESDEEAEQISQHLFKSYNSLDLEIIKVPLMDRQKRVDFILKNLLSF